MGSNLNSIISWVHILKEISSPTDIVSHSLFFLSPFLYLSLLSLSLPLHIEVCACVRTCLLICVPE